MARLFLIIAIVFVALKMKNIKMSENEETSSMEIKSLKEEESIELINVTEEAEVEIEKAIKNNEEYKILEETEDDEIKELINRIRKEKGLNEDNFAFFYYNTDLKKFYSYNENTYFKAASTVKMPVAMLYYDKAKNNELSIDDTILYTSESYEDGAGNTSSKYSPGSRVPISYLIKESIIYSDNTANNILMNHIGRTECRKQIAKYTEVQVSSEFYENNVVSAKIGYDFVKHLYENMEDYKELIKYLKKSSNEEYLKKYIDYDIAHKYGSYEGYEHDYGIVFGKTTYLIGVYTKDVSDSKELIANISLKVLQNIEDSKE